MNFFIKNNVVGINFSFAKKLQPKMEHRGRCEGGATLESHDQPEEVSAFEGGDPPRGPYAECSRSLECNLVRFIERHYYFSVKTVVGYFPGTT